MLKTFVFILCFLSPVIFFLSIPAQAHKIRIFAYGDGESIAGETAFSGGRSPKNAEIVVQDMAGETLLTIRTDENGQFRFPVPQKAKRNRLDLRIIVNAGEGHRGEWLLKADEYLTEVEAGPNQAGNREHVVATSPGNITSKKNQSDEELIRRVVEEVMDQKLGPVKRMLAKGKDQGPDFRDILGGIGYIFGMAGIIAYVKSRKKGKNDE